MLVTLFHMDEYAKHDIPQTQAERGRCMFGKGKSFTTRELWVRHDGKRVYGVLYEPKGLHGIW